MARKRTGGAGAPGRAAYAGVDTHKDTNMLALEDALGRPLGSWEFPADPAGYAALAERIGDPSVPVGVEGARSYGAGLAAHLSSEGYEVFEVVRPRREQRRRGKTDEADALAACDNLAAGRCRPAKELGGGLEGLRWLMVARDQLVAWASRLSSCVDAMLVTAPEPARARWRGLAGAPLMRALARTRGRDGVGLALRAMARQWLAADEAAGALWREIAALAARLCPALVGAPCVGPVSAARLLLAAGSNPGRLGGEAAFSMLCGTSPVPASSGRTDRHRLNRGGDRQANRAIHEIAVARMSHDERTKAYVKKKKGEGKTKREAVRCLCRYIAREAYRLIVGPQDVACDQSALAARRRAAGLTQSRVAEGAGVTRSKVSRLERMVEFDSAALAAIDAFLASCEKSGDGGPGLDNT